MCHFLPRLAHNFHAHQGRSLQDIAASSLTARWDVHRLESPIHEQAQIGRDRPPPPGLGRLNVRAAEEACEQRAAKCQFASPTARITDRSSGGGGSITVEWTYLWRRTVRKPDCDTHPMRLIHACVAVYVCRHRQRPAGDDGWTHSRRRATITDRLFPPHRVPIESPLVCKNVRTKAVVGGLRNYVCDGPLPVTDFTSTKSDSNHGTRTL